MAVLWRVRHEAEKEREEKGLQRLYFWENFIDTVSWGK